MLKPTGIYLLDAIMRGGFPAGSLVYFIADPDSMAEVFLYQFTSSRRTYYITTARKPEYLRMNISSIGCVKDLGEVIFIDVYSRYYLDGAGGGGRKDEEIIEWIEETLEKIRDEERGQEFNIIVDTFSFFLELNVDSFRIIKLVNLIYEIVKECGGLAFLFVLSETHDRKIENEIMNIADVIFKVDIERVGHRMNNRFSITKVRGMSPIPEFIKFRVGPQGIEIDTSRDIA